MDTAVFDSTLVDATVRVTGVDLDSLATGEVLAANFPDLIWEEQGNLITFTASFSRNEVMDDVVDVCRRLEAQIPGLKVKGVYRDLVNATDVAARIGVSREAVRKWTAHIDFPPPEGVVGGDSVKVWIWTEIVAWLRDARGFELDENLLSIQQMTQLENCLMRNPDHTTMQWQTTQPGRAGRSGPVFSPMQRGSGHRVVIDAASGRGQSSVDEDRSALVGAGRFRG